MRNRQMRKTGMKKIICTLLIAMPFSLSAAIVDYGTYFQDTATGLYWLKLTETRNQSYDDVDAQTSAGQPLEGWRFATLEEVESFIAGYGLPNQGKDCGDGWGNYCDGVEAANAELLEDLIRLLGDTLDAGNDEANTQNDVGPDGAGAARGLLGRRGDPGGSYYYHVYAAHIYDQEQVDRVTRLPAYDGRDQISVRPDTASDYGSSATGSFLVRTTDPTVALPDPNDPNTLAVTLFEGLSPGEIGLNADVYCDNFGTGAYGDGCLYDAHGWSTSGWPDHTGQILYGDFQLQNWAFDEDARPWVRMTGYDYTAASCLAGDTDLGDNWCRKVIASAEFKLMPAPRTTYDPYAPPEGLVPDTYIDHGDHFELDNVTLEFIHSNIQIDFEPWNSANTVRPKSAYFTTVGVKTLSTADGDAVDFDAGTVDPATVQFGPERTPNIASPLPQDFDGDGDADMIFGFRMENTGISCLDNSVSFVAKTYAGNPLAGQASISPIECEETIDIDVDPFNIVNTIRPNDSYNVTVALLGMRVADGDAVDVKPGTDTANDIDPATLRFGPAATSNTSTPVITDINGDAHDDMLVTFNAFDAGIACGDTELEVTGAKISGIPVEATDSIVTDDCETSGCHP
jgi:hypothetical protein